MLYLLNNWIIYYYFLSFFKLHACMHTVKVLHSCLTVPFLLTVHMVNSAQREKFFVFKVVNFGSLKRVETSRTSNVYIFIGEQLFDHAQEVSIERPDFWSALLEERIACIWILPLLYRCVESHVEQWNDRTGRTQKAEKEVTFDICWYTFFLLFGFATKGERLSAQMLLVTRVDSVGNTTTMTLKMF